VIAFPFKFKNSNEERCEGPIRQGQKLLDGMKLFCRIFFLSPATSTNIDEDVSLSRKQGAFKGINLNSTLQMFKTGIVVIVVALEFCGFQFTYGSKQRNEHFLLFNVLRHSQQFRQRLSSRMSLCLRLKMHNLLWHKGWLKVTSYCQ
jgi:hypothetical protein